MKKLIVGLLAAFLMSAGFAAVTAPPASAADDDCKYQSCVQTSTVGVGQGVEEYTKKGKLKRKGTGVISAKVSANSSVTPVGEVCVDVKKKGSTRIKATQCGNVDQLGKIKFSIPKLKRGVLWVFRVRFQGNQSNGFGNSTDIGRFTV